MNLQSVSGEAPKPGGVLKKYFDPVNSPNKRYLLQGDPTERSIQTKAQQFLAGDLLYIPTEVLLRLKVRGGSAAIGWASSSFVGADPCVRPAASNVTAIRPYKSLLYPK